MNEDDRFELEEDPESEAPAVPFPARAASPAELNPVEPSHREAPEDQGILSALDDRHRKPLIRFVPTSVSPAWASTPVDIHRSEAVRGALRLCGMRISRT